MIEFIWHPPLKFVSKVSALFTSSKFWFASESCLDGPRQLRRNVQDNNIGLICSAAVAN